MLLPAVVCYAEYDGDEPDSGEHCLACLERTTAHQRL